MRWRDEIKRSSQLRTLLKRVVENRTWKKNSGPYAIWTHDLCDTDTALYQLNLQANWELVYVLGPNKPSK